MTSNAEHFAALVAHPYGLAAMEIMVQKHRAHFLASRDRTKTRRALIRRFIETLGLRDEIAGARARARGMKG